MAQCHGSNSTQMRGRCCFMALHGRQRAAGPHEGEFSAQTIGAQRLAQLGAQAQQIIANLDFVEQFAGLQNVFAQALVLQCPFVSKALWVALESVAAFDDGDALIYVLRRAYLYRQAKAVKQLGAQFAFFGVAAADQHKARGVAHRQAFALDHILARGGDIDEQIDQMVFQQIDFVDI